MLKGMAFTRTAYAVMLQSCLAELDNSPTWQQWFRSLPLYSTIANPAPVPSDAVGAGSASAMPKFVAPSTDDLNNALQAVCAAIERRLDHLMRATGGGIGEIVLVFDGEARHHSHGDATNLKLHHSKRRRVNILEHAAEVFAALPVESLARGDGIPKRVASAASRSIFLTNAMTDCIRRWATTAFCRCVSTISSAHEADGQLRALATEGYVVYTDDADAVADGCEVVVRRVNQKAETAQLVTLRRLQGTGSVLSSLNSPTWLTIAAACIGTESTQLHADGMGFATALSAVAAIGSGSSSPRLALGQQLRKLRQYIQGQRTAEGNPTTVARWMEDNGALWEEDMKAAIVDRYRSPVAVGVADVKPLSKLVNQVLRFDWLPVDTDATPSESPIVTVGRGVECVLCKQRAVQTEWVKTCERLQSSEGQQALRECPDSGPKQLQERLAHLQTNHVASAAAVEVRCVFDCVCVTVRMCHCV